MQSTETAEPGDDPGVATGGDARAIARAAADGGARRVVSTLRRFLGAEVGLFDLLGNALAQSPNRALWDWRTVLRLRDASSAPDEPPLTVRGVESGGEVLALLAARVHDDHDGLLDVAASIVALDILRDRARQEGRRELAATILDDLIADRLGPSELPSRLAALGIDPDEPVRMLVGWAEGPRERFTNLPWNVHTMMADQDDAIVHVLVRGRLVAIVPDSPMIDRVATTLLDHLRTAGPGARIGVSRPHTGAGGIRVGYWEALAAAEHADGVAHVGAVDLTSVLLVGNTDLPLRDMAAGVLDPILEYDDRNSGELVRTLRTYLTNDRNTANTASDLFIHPNTLRYRLKQIVTLLDVDLDSIRTLATLWIALEALAEGNPTA